MTDVKENEKEVTAETQTVDVPAGTTVENATESQPTKEVDPRETLAQNMLKVVGAISQVSQFPHRPYRELRDELRNVLKSYDESASAVYGHPTKEIQQAWIDDLFDVIAEIPELIHSLNLATFLREVRRPNIQRLLDQTTWMQALRARKGGVQYMPIQVEFEDDSIVVGGSDVRLRKLIEKFQLLHNIQQLEEIAGSEHYSEFYLPLYVNLVYPVFAELISDEKQLPMTHFFNTPALVLPLRSEHYAEYTRGDEADKESESALAKLLRERQGKEEAVETETEEVKEPQYVTDVFRLEKDENEMTQLMVLSDESEWEQVEVDEKDEVKQACLASVIAELIECDPEAATYTVITKEISLIEAIQKVQTVEAKIMSANKEDAVEITFFNYN